MIKIESIMTQNKQVLYLVKKEIKSLTAFHKRNGQLGNSRKKTTRGGRMEFIRIGILKKQQVQFPRVS